MQEKSNDMVATRARPTLYGTTAQPHSATWPELVPFLLISYAGDETLSYAYEQFPTYRNAAPHDEIEYGRNLWKLARRVGGFFARNFAPHSLRPRPPPQYSPHHRRLEVRRPQRRLDALATFAQGIGINKVRNGAPHISSHENPNQGPQSPPKNNHDNNKNNNNPYRWTLATVCRSEKPWRVEWENTDVTNYPDTPVLLFDALGVAPTPRANRSNRQGIQHHHQYIQHQ